VEGLVALAVVLTGTQLIAVTRPSAGYRISTTTDGQPPHAQSVRSGFWVHRQRARRDQHEDEHIRSMTVQPVPVDYCRRGGSAPSSRAAAFSGVGEQPADDEEDPSADGQRGRDLSDDAALWRAA
jgi:hypothetical protein